ncbi:nucleotide exchange factor GrpE [Candidatus Gracilibacteria bacterium]|nr:nucleotide exchange factor GrpE [Candidatus Gracilibacteria bacterium]NJM88697.1 nucleotide exchange factor GrpE [Hydrococcus sp. RU_2_2]NJP18689.1 nucleotide exchange factor GrpE [Hydrococcus sp. CRU_1_1]
MIDEQNQLENNPESLDNKINASEEQGSSATEANAGEMQANATTETPAIAQTTSPSQTAEQLEAAQTIAVLTQEVESLKQQLEQQTDALKKRYISLAAEFDNFRKRTQKEKEDLETEIKCKTITELLAVVDNFERARVQLKPANDGEMAIHKSYQSVYKYLVDSLKRLGVSAMRPEGQSFDPAYHEAMLREYTDEHPEGTVIEQLVRGYTLGDRVLRHAMVKVAAPKESTETSEEEQSQQEQTDNPAN